MHQLFSDVINLRISQSQALGIVQLVDELVNLVGILERDRQALGGVIDVHVG